MMPTQLPLSTQIAGRKTVEDWNKLKLKLSYFKDEKAWRTAFKDYYHARLQERYLNPIATIRENEKFSGEGFAIMAIICSLIEFLESIYQGKNYRYRKKGDSALTTFEYGGSEDIFVSFLTKRTPFNTEFDNNTASEFYKCIRCGLLHEARTKGNWKIRAFGTSMIRKTSDSTIVSRNKFLVGIHSFIKDYEVELSKNDKLKEAFIRKFDNLCEK